MKHFKKHHTFLFCVIFSCIFISASCNKETGPTSVNGTVKDITTNVGVSDAQVGLIETDGESGFGLSGTLLEEKYSDATGNFTFDFNARQGYSYYVQAIKDQYWNDQSNNITFVHELGGTDELTVYLQPEGFLNVHIKNINVYDVGDYISFSNAYQTFYGNDVDTTVLLLIYGNSSNHLVWFVYDDGISSGSESADVYCTAFDTTYYEILY